MSLSNHEARTAFGATTSFDKLRTNGWVWALLFLIALLVALPAAAAPKFPALSGRVVDAANVLPPATEAALDAKLNGLEQRTGNQLVVATVPDLGGYEIEDYGYQLGRAWGIGQKGKNNGAILLVAPTERKVRIEVGYGLEGVLTDAITSVIIQQRIVPAFKAGDMAGGVEAGADAIVTQLGLTPEEAQASAQRAAEMQSQGSDESGGFNLGWVFWVVVIFFWIIPALFRKRGRRYRSGLGNALPMILWAASQGGGRGGGGGWGGGGGGGFSGGGGSFGGGGSSGSW